MSTIAILGAGYVGVPLADTFGRAGHSILLVDVQQERVEMLNRGESFVDDVPSERVKELVDDGRLKATLDYDDLRGADAILIALPTPLSPQREPDLSIVLDATRGVAQRLEKGQLIVLESTTYPGTTRERLLPILEEGGLKVGEDFHLAFSPERVDPGREDWTTKTTPKFVGGITEDCTRKAVELYESALDIVLPLSSCKARQYDFDTEFSELADKVNANMPYFCRSLISQALNHGRELSLKGAKVLMLGVSYKADVQDTRESPAIKLIELLRNAGADVAYHDPHVPALPEIGLSSVALAPAEHDCVVIVTAHSSIDYERVVEDAPLVVDLRNATSRSGRVDGKVWKL